MASHSSVLAWRIPGTGEPGGLPSMGSHRVGHDWSDLAAAAADLSHSQLQVLFLRTVWSFSIFSCKEYNQSDYSIDHLVMFMCGFVPCVCGRGCLLWPVCSLGKTLLAFALLHFVLQGQIFLGVTPGLLLQVSLDFYFCISVPSDEKDIILGICSRRPCRSS